MRKVKILLIIFICSFSFVQFSLAQTFSPEEQHQLDSLNAIIKDPGSHDTSLAGAYVGLSEILAISNLDTIIPLCQITKSIVEDRLKKSLPASVKLSFLISLSHALNNIGYVYYSKGNIPEGLDYFIKSLKIDEEIGDKESIAYSLNNIGIIYASQGDIPKGLEYFHRSLKIAEEIGDKYGVAYALNNIGYNYYIQGDFTEAILYYQKSLKLREEIEYKRGISISLNNIGVVYIELRDYPTALEYFFKSLKIQEELNDEVGIAYSLNNIGEIYKRQDDIKNANIFFSKSLKIFEKLEDKGGTAMTLNNLGYVMLDNGDINKAQNLAYRSLELSQEIGNPERITKAASLLSKIYEKQNKGMQALEMHKLYITMRDSINDEETQRATAQQQAKYEYEKQKVIDDAEHDILLAVEQEEKEKQQILTGATAGVLGLVMVFLFFVFNRLKITRKQKLVIETQKAKVEKQRDVIEDTHKEIVDSIEYAKRIQGAILPPARIVKEYLEDSFIYYLPKDVVAGDFYWMRHHEKKILFAAADCTGHGVPGAMVSVVCNMALNRAVREYGLTDPGEILDKTRSIVIREFEKSDEEVNDGMDIALCTLEGYKLQYAGAYNPLWIIRDGELMETKANRYPIGLSRDPIPFTTHSIDLKKGDVIYIFTDGLVDQFGGENGKKLKIAGFKRMLLNMHDKPMETQQKIIADAFYDWKGDLEQVDDICLIGVRV